MVQTRQPLSFCEEFIYAGVRFNRERLVIECALEADAGGLVFVIVPFVFVILFFKGAVAEPTDFALDDPIVEGSADDVLAVVPEYAAAEIAFGIDIAALAAEVIMTMIVYEPRIKAASCGSIDAEEGVAGILNTRAKPETALAHVVEVKVPFHALRALHAEELEGVESEQGLIAEDAVVAEAEVINVIVRVV